MHQLPHAILFDLDDTLVSAYNEPERAWRTVLHEHADRLPHLAHVELVHEIMSHARAFWSDPAHHRQWRMKLFEARREILRGVRKRLAAAGHTLSDELAVAIADRFSALREEQMCLFPGAIDTLDALQRAGVALALVTNGDAELQRGKIARFELARYFHHIQIEGEHGFGKPEPRAYRHAMEALAVSAHETWMVGDNLEWEVAAPQRLGIYAIWHDVQGRGLPEGSAVRPDRIVRSVRELLSAEPAR